MRQAGSLLSLISLASLTLLSGCVAEMVEKHTPRKGPIPEVGYIDTGGGDVRYSVDGWGVVVKMRRGTALRKMRRVCKAKDLYAKISDEYTHDDVDPNYAGEDLDVNMQHGLDQYHVAPYHHIVFDCKQVEKPIVKPSQDKKQ